MKIKGKNDMNAEKKLIINRNESFDLEKILENNDLPSNLKNEFNVFFLVGADQKINFYNLGLYKYFKINDNSDVVPYIPSKLETYETFSETQLIDLGLIVLKEIGINIIIGLLIEYFNRLPKKNDIKCKIKNKKFEIEYEGPADNLHEIIEKIESE